MATLKNILDKRLIKYLMLFFMVSFLISTVSAFIGKAEGVAFSSYTWYELSVNLMVRYAFKFLFIFSAILFVRYLFLKKIVSRWGQIILHFLFAITLTFYSVFVQLLGSNWFFGANEDVTWDYIYRSSILGTDYNFFLYFCMIAIVYAYYAFVKQKDLEIKENQLKTQLLDSKLNALQSQLQPHFLFNALNDISSLVDVSPEKSQDAIVDLSDLLRQTLSLNNTKYISVLDEISLVKKYLDIEKIRFQDKLNFSFTISEKSKTFNMPPLLLQPIVENSIKHGYSMEHDIISVLIEIVEEPDKIAFFITNNGKPINSEKITYGTGIQNVISRLQTLYENNFVFDMMNTKDHKVRTVLKIPKSLDTVSGSLDL
jgi:hypothetical protein